MTLLDQIVWHDDMYRNYPVVHQHSDDAPTRFFFHRLMTTGFGYRVLEFGGWTGETATETLATYPAEGGIMSWSNYEICVPAVQNHRVPDPRYRAQVLDSWPWEQTWIGYNVLFMQHVVEHMRFAQFQELLKRVPDVQWIFIQSPLEDGPRNWAGYGGAHILEVGWDGLHSVLTEQAFEIQFLFGDSENPNATAKENGRTRIYRRLQPSGQ